MYGYDLDGTLAGTDFKQSHGPNGQVNVIISAKVLYTAPQPFVAITARGTDPKVQKATRLWLKQHQPNNQGVEFVSGSDQQVINAKARAIQQHKVTDYVDNNSKLLTGLKQILPNVNYYLFTGGKPVKF